MFGKRRAAAPSSPSAAATSSSSPAPPFTIAGHHSRNVSDSTTASRLEGRPSPSPLQMTFDFELDAPGPQRATDQRRPLQDADRSPRPDGSFVDVRKSMVSQAPPVLPPIPRVASRYVKDTGSRSTESLKQAMPTQSGSATDVRKEEMSGTSNQSQLRPRLSFEKPLERRSFSRPGSSTGAETRESRGITVNPSDSEDAAMFRRDSSPLAQRPNHPSEPFDMRHDTSAFPEPSTLHPDDRLVADSRARVSSTSHAWPQPQESVQATRSTPDLLSTLRSPSFPSLLGNNDIPAQHRSPLSALRRSSTAEWQSAQMASSPQFLQTPATPSKHGLSASPKSSQSSRSQELSPSHVGTVGTPYDRTSPAFPLPHTMSTLPKSGTATSSATIGGISVPTHHSTATLPRAEPVKPEKNEKRKTRLLSPFALLAKRRAGQEDETLVKERAAQEQALARQKDVAAVGVSKLPEDFDPRIKGKKVHDFSAPRPSRRNVSHSGDVDTAGHTPAAGSASASSSSAPFIPALKDHDPLSLSTGQTITEQPPPRRTSHVPVFVEHLSENPDHARRLSSLQAERLENKDFLQRASYVSSISALSQESSGHHHHLPPFARRSQQFDLPGSAQAAGGGGGGGGGFSSSEEESRRLSDQSSSGKDRRSSGTSSFSAGQNLGRFSGTSQQQQQQQPLPDVTRYDGQQQQQQQQQQLLQQSKSPVSPSVSSARSQQQQHAASESSGRKSSSIDSAAAAAKRRTTLDTMASSSSAGGAVSSGGQSARGSSTAQEQMPQPLGTSSEVAVTDEEFASPAQDEILPTSGPQQESSETTQAMPIPQQKEHQQHHHQHQALADLQQRESTLTQEILIPPNLNTGTPESPLPSPSFASSQGSPVIGTAEVAAAPLRTQPMNRPKLVDRPSSSSVLTSTAAAANAEPAGASSIAPTPPRATASPASGLASGPGPSQTAKPSFRSGGGGSSSGIRHHVSNASRFSFQFGGSAAEEHLEDKHRRRRAAAAGSAASAATASGGGQGREVADEYDEDDYFDEDAMDDMDEMEFEAAGGSGGGYDDFDDDADDTDDAIRCTFEGESPSFSEKQRDEREEEEEMPLASPGTFMSLSEARAQLRADSDSDSDDGQTGYVGPSKSQADRMAANGFFPSGQPATSSTAGMSSKGTTFMQPQSDIYGKQTGYDASGDAMTSASLRDSGNTSQRQRAESSFSFDMNEAAAMRQSGLSGSSAVSGGSNKYNSNNHHISHVTDGSSTRPFSQSTAGASHSSYSEPPRTASGGIGLGLGLSNNSLDGGAMGNSTYADTPATSRPPSSTQLDGSGGRSAAVGAGHKRNVTGGSQTLPFAQATAQWQQNRVSSYPLAAAAAAATASRPWSAGQQQQHQYQHQHQNQYQQYGQPPDFNRRGGSGDDDDLYFDDGGFDPDVNTHDLGEAMDESKFDDDSFLARKPATAAAPAAVPPPNNVNNGGSSRPQSQPQMRISPMPPMVIGGPGALPGGSPGPYPSFAMPNPHRARQRDSQLMLEDLPLHSAGPTSVGLGSDGFSSSVDPKLIPQRNPSEDAKRLGLSDKVPPLPPPPGNLSAMQQISANLNAYHAALADAATKAAAEGRFSRMPTSSTDRSRSFSSRIADEELHNVSKDDRSSYSFDADGPPRDEGLDRGVSGLTIDPQPNQTTMYSPSKAAFDFGFEDTQSSFVPQADIRDSFLPGGVGHGIGDIMDGMDDDGMDDFDDADMIAAANSEALASDDEGFYGQEFGFYAKARHVAGGSGGSGSVLEAINGGFFGEDGDDGLTRNKSLKEPNLTPITERSEFSTRNSFIGGPNLFFGPASSASAAGGAAVGQHRRMSVSPLFEGEVTSFEELRRLRASAFGGSTASLHSDGGSGSGRGGSPRSATASGSFSVLGPTSGSPSTFYPNIPSAMGGGEGMSFAYSNGSSGSSSNPASAVPYHHSQSSYSQGQYSHSNSRSHSHSNSLSQIYPPPQFSNSQHSASSSPLHRFNEPSSPLSSSPPVDLDATPRRPANLTQHYSAASPPAGNIPPIPLALSGGGAVANRGMSYAGADAAVPRIQTFAHHHPSYGGSNSTSGPTAGNAAGGTGNVSSHSRKSSGGGTGAAGGTADSVTYVQEEQENGPPRWVMERRRTSEQGFLELVGREVVQGGWI